MLHGLSKYCLLSALILLLCCALPLRAQSSPTEKVDSTAAGKITGRVVNENGQGIPNAVVSVSGYGEDEGQEVATDANGNFKIIGLSRIAYRLSAEVPGYVPKPRDPDSNPIGYYHAGDAVRLEMTKGGVITGTVTKANGDPVVGADVRAYLIRDYKGQTVRYSTPSSSRETDDRGVYRMYGLAPGTYVVSAGGGDMSDYAVKPFGTDAPTFAPSSTRDTAIEITVNSGEEAANIDIHYRGDPGHVVSGKIANSSGTEGHSFEVVLYSEVRGGQHAAYNVYSHSVSRGFIFSGVADGEYQIVAQGESRSGWFLSEPLRINVTGADVTGVELNFKPLASISGSLVFEDAKAPGCQDKPRPLLGETVIGAYHNEKNAAKEQPQFVWDLGQPVTPDSHGAFVLRNLAAGQYRFSTRPLAKFWYLKSIAWPAVARAAQANQPLDAARNWTTIKTGDKLSGLTITFASGAGSLQGRIENPVKSLPPRAFVYLAPAESDKREDVLRYFAVLAESDGSFAIGNIPPGRYWVLAKAAVESDANMLSKLRLPDETQLRAKILHDGELAKASAELKPCQSVSDYKVPLRPIE
ncbi:MAG TPA: carboxypeptidase-like regulatory domain-containing protein [Pyrinomonadaceae bacterium]|nr:carboxypeptidase-like regulatory domain-containing protein [Pyrinomonadaceae bacterium]